MPRRMELQPRGGSRLLPQPKFQALFPIPYHLFSRPPTMNLEPYPSNPNPSNRLRACSAPEDRSTPLPPPPPPAHPPTAFLTPNRPNQAVCLQCPAGWICNPGGVVDYSKGTFLASEGLQACAARHGGMVHPTPDT